MEKLKKKYSHMYSIFQEGNAGIKELQWLLDNIDHVKDDKPKYIIVKESKLVEVQPDGTIVKRN